MLTNIYDNGTFVNVVEPRCAIFREKPKFSRYLGVWISHLKKIRGKSDHFEGSNKSHQVAKWGSKLTEIFQIFVAIASTVH